MVGTTLTLIVNFSLGAILVPYQFKNRLLGLVCTQSYNDRFSQPPHYVNLVYSKENRVRLKCIKFKVHLFIVSMEKYTLLSMNLVIITKNFKSLYLDCC